MTGRIDLKLLTAFVTVAREGNVSRAAEILCLTQPAVSLQLRRLSQETGLELFTRSPRGLELTADGRALLVKARRVLAALEEFGQYAENLHRTVHGTLRIGTIIDPSYIRLGDLLQGLMRRAPELRPELTHGISGAVLRDILAERLDVGYFLGPVEDFLPFLPAGTAPAPADFLRRELIRFRYRVIAPAGWEGQLRQLDWAGLAGLPWIGTPPDSVHHRLLARILGPLGVRQNVVTLADQEDSMLELVRAGLGLSLAREAVALREQQVHGLAVAQDIALETPLSFVAMAKRANDPRIRLAMDSIDHIWRS